MSWPRRPRSRAAPSATPPWSPGCVTPPSPCRCAANVTMTPSTRQTAHWGTTTSPSLPATTRPRALPLRRRSPRHHGVHLDSELAPGVPDLSSLGPMTPGTSPSMAPHLCTTTTSPSSALLCAGEPRLCYALPKSRTPTPPRRPPFSPLVLHLAAAAVPPQQRPVFTEPRRTEPDTATPTASASRGCHCAAGLLHRCHSLLTTPRSGQQQHLAGRLRPCHRSSVAPLATRCSSWPTTASPRPPPASCS